LNYSLNDFQRKLLGIILIHALFIVIMFNVGVYFLTINQPDKVNTEIEVLFGLIAFFVCCIVAGYFIYRCMKAVQTHLKLGRNEQ